MRGTSLKLSYLLVVLLSFALFLFPFTAEARYKAYKHVPETNCDHRWRRPPQAPTPAPTPAPAHVGVPPYQTHGCGYPCNDSNDCDLPCTICCANQTCCYDQPFYPSFTPSPSPSIEPPTIVPEPYQTHGCGYPCNDSNDCDWPCMTCAPNNTCGYDQPFLPPTTPPLPPSPSIEPAAPPPYQIHGCGYPCNDSNDCDSSCTVCCYNQTCCHEEPFIILSPPSSSPAPSPAPMFLTPPPMVEAPEPTGSASVPPYVIHGCGYPCFDSNDCDWPCTLCRTNGTHRTCCYEEPFVTFPLPPSPPPQSSPPPLSTLPLPLPPSPSPSPVTSEVGDDYYELAPEPAYDIGVPGDDEPPTMPYKAHGCNYRPCWEDNDCDWPCTRCCLDNTCCHEKAWPPTMF